MESDDPAFIAAPITRKRPVVLGEFPSRTTGSTEHLSPGGQRKNILSLIRFACGSVLIVYIPKVKEDDPVRRSYLPATPAGRTHYFGTVCHTRYLRATGLMCLPEVMSVLPTLDGASSVYDNRIGTQLCLKTANKKVACPVCGIRCQ